MNFLISPAYAAGSGGTGESILPTVIMVGLFFVFMYFMIIRPQMKRQKEHRKLMESLQKGSEIVTSGGMAGRIRQVGENFLVVEVSDGVEVRIQKSSVASVVPKGTLDSL